MICPRCGQEVTSEMAVCPYCQNPLNVPGAPAPATPAAPPPPSTIPADVSKPGFAIASLALGVFSMFAWLIPICGGLTGIAGVVLGVVGLRSRNRGMAIAGIITSALGFVLALVNAVAGVALVWTNMPSS